MLNIGDKVKFLNDVGGGTVLSFQSKKIAIVENDDGFELPVLITELLKVAEAESYQVVSRPFYPNKKETKVAEPEPELEPEIIPGNDAPRFFMAFYPTDQNNPVGGEIEIYLINDSNFSLLYHYAHFDGIKYETVDTGVLEPNTKNYIEGLSQIDLSNLPRFFFRIIPFMKESRQLVDPVVKEISVNAVKFYKEKSFGVNDFFDGNAMVFDLVSNPIKENLDKLTETDFKKIVNTKDKENRPLEHQKPIKKVQDIVEVDLHIAELIDSIAGLSNREILEIQIEKFKREMDIAIKDKVKRVVFIHGVGNGVLKLEVAKKLKADYARFHFQDASFKEYGFGATMVILHRK